MDYFYAHSSFLYQNPNIKDPPAAEVNEHRIAAAYFLHIVSFEVTAI